MPKTIISALADAAIRLAGTSESPKLDGEALLASILDVPRSHLFAHPEEELTGQVATEFEAAIKRRAAGEPVAYITGYKEFWSLQLRVTADMLVPRPETELLVEQALQLIPEDQVRRILDLGTGSGAVAIAIASERPKSVLVATDSSSKALAVAKENAALNKVDNIQFLHGNWTKPVADQSFDIIVSNPPYVREDDPALEKLKFEPTTALAAGPDGMDAIRVIAKEVIAVFNAHGTLLLEHGADQVDTVAAVLRQNGFTDIRCFTDLAGHPRATRARMDTPSTQDKA